MATESTFDIDSFLSTLAMSYAITAPSSDEKTCVVIPTKKAYTRKVKMTVVAEPIVAEVSPVVKPVVQPGTVDATEFFALLKKAGRRPNTVGVLLYTTEHTQRQDERYAIEAYIGWDHKLLHGTNLDNARTAANRELRVGSLTGKEYCRSSKPSLDGYVAGIPDGQKERLDNLMGRISRALDEVLEHESIANDEDLPQGTREHHSRMAKLENERILQLNGDIRNLGF